MARNNGPFRDDELRKDVEAYVASGGNRSEAARLRDMPRVTFRDRLKLAEKRFRLHLGKIVDGRRDYVEARQMPLPKKGGIARYILTSAQNNTHPHKDGLNNLLAYVNCLDQLQLAPGLVGCGEMNSLPRTRARAGGPGAGADPRRRDRLRPPGREESIASLP